MRRTGVDELYVAARRVLLDALEVLAGHLPSLVQVGAHAVYLQVGESDLAVAPSTTGADLALDPRTLADRPALSLVGFQQRTAHEVDRFGPDAGPDLVVNGHAEDTIAGHRPLASNHLGNYTLVRRASRLFQGSLDMYQTTPFPSPRLFARRLSVWAIRSGSVFPPPSTWHWGRTWKSSFELSTFGPRGTSIWNPWGTILWFPSVRVARFRTSASNAS